MTGPVLGYEYLRRLTLRNVLAGKMRPGQTRMVDWLRKVKVSIWLEDSARFRRWSQLPDPSWTWLIQHPLSLTKEEIEIMRGLTSALNV